MDTTVTDVANALIPTPASDDMIILPPMSPFLPPGEVDHNAGASLVDHNAGASAPTSPDEEGIADTVYVYTTLTDSESVRHIAKAFKVTAKELVIEEEHNSSSKALEDRPKKLARQLGFEVEDEEESQHEH